MKSIVVDTEVMGDLVHDGDADLLDQLGLVAADVAQRQPVQRDDIGKDEPAVVLPLGQWNALVEPQQVLIGVLVLGDDGDVLHQTTEFVGERIERIADEAFESGAADGLHAGDTTDRAG